MKQINIACLSIILALIVLSCPTGSNEPDPDNPEPNNPIILYDRDFRGEWIRMDTGDRWYVSGSAIRINGTVSNQQVSFERRSDNVVIAEGPTGQKYTLFAARIANAAFSAQVVFLDTDGSTQTNVGRSAIGTIGQMPPIKIINPVQPDIPITVEPDPETGEIIVDGVIPGDPIELVPDDPAWENITIELTPSWGEDQNMGTIALTQGDNFKVSVRMEHYIAGVTDLYADGVPREYIFEIENIGTTNSGDVGLDISWDDEDFTLITGHPGADFANIAPGSRREIRLTLASKTIETGFKTKGFNISIWNYDSRSRSVREWEDNVTINYFKVPVPFQFRSQNPVQGIIKARRGQTYYFMTSRPAGSESDYSAIVFVPWSSEVYTIAFLGATIEEESATRYSLAVGEIPPANWNSLNPRDFLTQYKPDNEYEETAPYLDFTVGDRTFMGYLAGDSIDYYRVWLGNEPFEFRTINMDDWAIRELPGGYFDNEPNPGETINLDLRFINSSPETRTLTMTSLSPAAGYTQYIHNIHVPAQSLILPSGHYGSLTSNTTSQNRNAVLLLNAVNINQAFQFRLSPDCPEGPVSLIITFRDNIGMEYTQAITFDVALPPINIVLESGDVTASPGDTFDAAVTARNAGVEDAFGVTARLTTPESNNAHFVVINTSTNVAIGMISAGTVSAEAVFSVSILAGCPIGVEIPLRVTFTNNEGNSWHDEFNIFVLSPAPVNVQAAAVSENAVRISWDSISGATGYRVYDAAGAVLSTLGNVTQYDHDGLNPGMVYSYRVSSLTGSGESAQSAAVTARTWERLMFNRQYNSGANTSVPHYYRFNVTSGTSYSFTSNVSAAVRYEAGDAAWFTLNAGTANQAAAQSGWAYIRIDEGAYTVSVRHPEAAISAFTVLSNAGTINEADKTITVNVPFGTSLISLTPSVTPASGWTSAVTGVQNFTNPVEYIFTRGDVSQVYMAEVIPGGQGGIDIIHPPINDIVITGFPTAPFTLSRSGAGGFLASRNISLDTGYSSIEWWIGETSYTSAATNGGRNFTVQASALLLGGHTLTVFVFVDGVPYSNEIDFTVVQ